uniref:Cytochrome c oxidase subunit 7A1, mitochondrial n=1 Tax=Anoplopoma fimbria TaxID=229290 RepID=C3KK88_ANOFI|nr:Cytochrome c oxidase polypeptide VIIa-liver/heart, mitochondrial precursor [Anoplopoma fimbria]
MQEDNGLPVHIKGGTFDVVLYRATMTLTLGGNEGRTHEEMLKV